MKRPRRLFTLAMVSTVAGVAACAAVLGIDDRQRDTFDGSSVDAPKGGDDGPSGGGDASDAATASDVVFDAPVIPGATCVPASCSSAGGQCIDNACQFKCAEKGCKNTTFVCPNDSDCQVFCAKQDDCEGIQCVGGKSCSIECNASGTCKNVACSSPSCTIHCKQLNTCDTAAFCDGGNCSIECEGNTSCNEIDFNAAGGCSIRCTGPASCASGDKLVSCNASPDASIYCAQAKDACKDVFPTCQGGQRCEIRCDTNEGCNKGVCCEAGVQCITDSGSTAVLNKNCK